MVKKRAKKAAPHTTLWKIGFWATLWWAISWLYILALVAHSLSFYANLPEGGNFFSDWSSALNSSYHSYGLFSSSLMIIVIGWVVGGVIWLLELKKQNIKYRSALKDLFLTVRK